MDGASSATATPSKACLEIRSPRKSCAASSCCSPPRWRGAMRNRCSYALRIWKTSAASRCRDFARAAPQSAAHSTHLLNRLCMDKTREQLVEYTDALSYAHLSASAIHAVKRSVIDSVGC